MNTQFSQKGVSLYLTLIIMTMLLSIALGLSSIFLGQTKVIRSMGHSVVAFYAADAGIEQILMVRSNPPIGTGPVVKLFGNDATYQVTVTTGGECLHYCITSVGVYRETRRAIEITY